MSTTEIVRRADNAPFIDVDLSGVQTLAKALFDSGVFPDVKSVAHAGVKIMAGAEMGLAPVEAMRSFHVIKGKVEFAAEFLAQRVRLHPHYDYRVLTLENDGCVIAFFRDGDELGVSSFDEEDRERAGLELETTKDGRTTPTPWKTFPRNMMFARAMSNGVAWYMPDIVAGVPALIDVVRPYGDLPDDPTSTIEVGEDAATRDDAPGSGGESGAAPSPDAASSKTSSKRKATQAQLTKLVLLAEEHGWDDDERHTRAGVSSFTDLTKQAASVLIEAWSVEEGPGGVSKGSGSEPGSDAETELPSAPGPDPNAPPSDEFKRSAIRHIGSESAIVVLARKFYPEVNGFTSINQGQLARVLEAWLHRKECKHAAEHREESGFCRRCGQMAGEAA